MGKYKVTIERMIMILFGPSLERKRISEIEKIGAYLEYWAPKVESYLKNGGSHRLSKVGECRKALKMKSGLEDASTSREINEACNNSRVWRNYKSFWRDWRNTHYKK